MSRYTELLKAPRWQKRRLDILSRAGFACEECGAEDKTLHVHHKLYRKGAKPWEYEDHELAALCEDCHEAEHVLRAALDRAIATMDRGDLEKLVGFAEGMVCMNITAAGTVPHEACFSVRSVLHAAGFLHALQPPAPETIGKVVSMGPRLTVGGGGPWLGSARSNPSSGSTRG